MTALTIHRASRALAMLTLSVSVLARACPSDVPTTLSLTLVPGEIRGVEHVLEVNVQQDGCLQVQRPAHWRDPGRLGGAVVTPSLRGGQVMSQMAPLAGFDGARVVTELAALEATRGQDFVVEGADRYVLRWIDGSGRPQEAAFAGVFQYTERYPDREDLAAFAALVAMLQAEATRDDLVDLEAAP